MRPPTWSLCASLALTRNANAELRLFVQGKYDHDEIDWRISLLYRPSKSDRRTAGQSTLANDANQRYTRQWQPTSLCLYQDFIILVESRMRWGETAQTVL